MVYSCHKVAAARQEPVNDRPVYAETTAAKVAAAEVEKSQCFLFMWFFLFFILFSPLLHLFFSPPCGIFNRETVLSAD